MFTFHEDYAEIDEEYGDNKIIKKLSYISTHLDRIRENSVFIKYFGLPLPRALIKYLKIKNIKECEYQNFEVFNVFFNVQKDQFEKEILFNMDEMPKYFFTYDCGNLFVDIKEDDINTYIVEIEHLDVFNPFNDTLKDDVLKLFKKDFRYILKDKVITLNMIENYTGRYNILSMDEYLKSGKPLISSFVEKIKSNSKSANKR